MQQLDKTVILAVECTEKGIKRLGQTFETVIKIENGFTLDVLVGKMNIWVKGHVYEFSQAGICIGKNIYPPTESHIYVEYFEKMAFYKIWKKEIYRLD